MQSIWRYERQNKNAEEIAAHAGRLHDQIALVAESLADVGKHIERAYKSQEQAMARLNSGKGNLVNRALKLEELGAKVNSEKASKLKKLSDNEE